MYGWIGIVALALVALAAAVAIGVRRQPRHVLGATAAVLRAACGVRHRTVVVDGYAWHYLDSGGEGRPVVLLVHGFGADKDNWLAYARLLRRRFRVVAPDLPGFGDTAREPGRDYSIAAQAEGLARFAAALGLARAHVAGNSLGGLIAAWLALRHPGFVASLALLDSAGVDGARKSEADLAIDRGENPFAIDDYAAFEAMLARLAYRPPRLPGFLKRALYAEMRRRQPFLKSQLWKLVAEMRSDLLAEQLPRLQVPVLVLWGREDRLVDVSSAVAIHQRVPGSRLVILDEVGHVPMFEAPRETALHHERFIDGLGRAAQPGVA